MKKLLFITILCVALGFTLASAQESLKIDDTTIIKDSEGNKISTETFNALIKSGEWSIFQKKDADGNDYIQLQKASKKQKKMLLQMLELEQDKSKLIGEKIAAFDFTDLNGNKITPETTKGKILVLNFWFIACKPCLEEIPKLNAVYEKFKDSEDVVFASVTFEQQPKVERFIKKYPIAYPLVTDEKMGIYRFKVKGYPTNLIIGHDGKITDYITGGFPGVGTRIETGITEALKSAAKQR